VHAYAHTYTCAHARTHTGSKDVQTASKGEQGKAGQFFPLTAVQKFEDGIFENGVFLGGC